MVRLLTLVALALMLNSFALGQDQEADSRTPWRDPNNRNVHVLDPDEASEGIGRC